MTRIFSKYTALVLVLALSLCLFSGCELPQEGPKPSETVGPSDATIPGGNVAPDEAFTAIDPDYFELLAEDCDMTIYTQSGIKIITLMLLSAQPLKKYDVSIGSDQGLTARVRLTEAKMQTTMPLNVYLCYQNFDWKAYAQQKQTDPIGAEELMERYQQELEQHKFNRLFFYKVQIFTDNLFSNCKDEHNQWALPQETVEIHDLTVTVKGQSKTYHPKCLRLTNAPFPVRSSTDMVRIHANQGFTVQPSANGQFTYNALWLTLAPIFGYNAQISQIGLPLQEGASVGPCPYAIYVPMEPTISGTLTEDSCIYLSGGDLKIILNWTDPDKANALGLTGLSYFTLYYETQPADPNESPERRCFTVPILYNIFSNAYEYYAWAHDGVDIMSYYRDYVAVVQEAPKA